jgi:hypothetical protein
MHINTSRVFEKAMVKLIFNLNNLTIKNSELKEECVHSKHQ